VPAWAGRALKGELWAHAEAEAHRVVAFGADVTDRAREFRTRSDRRRIAWMRHQQCVAAGIERYDPFMDLQLSDFVTSLPPEWLLHGGVCRGLFRETLRGLVPESFRMRLDKAEVDAAAARWVDASGGFAALRPLVSMTCLADLGAVEPRPFAEAFARFVARKDDGTGWTTVFPALTVEAFLRTREGLSSV
jgi:asparagine synthase (glutamine-hydrolysing)